MSNGFKPEKLKKNFSQRFQRTAEHSGARLLDGRSSSNRRIFRLSRAVSGGFCWSRTRAHIYLFIEDASAQRLSFALLSLRFGACFACACLHDISGMSPTASSSSSGPEPPFRPREKVLEKQRYFQSVQKPTYLKGRYDVVTSVAVPLALAVSSMYLVVSSRPRLSLLFI